FDYQVIKKDDYDIIRFYDTNFTIGDFFYFSNNNLDINKDSSIFILTNKHRVINDRKGLSVANNKSNMDIGISVPKGFEITNVKTTPSSIKVHKEKKIVTFSGSEIKEMIYEIEYKKVKINEEYSSQGKKEIHRKEITIDKKIYQIEIWDDDLE